MVLSSASDYSFEQKPAKLGLDRVQVLTHCLHEGLSPVRKLAILHVLLRRTRVYPVQQLELHLHLILDPQKLVREVFLLVAYVLADNHELVPKLQYRLRQVSLVKFHLHCVDFLLEISAFGRAGHQERKLRLLDPLDCLL